MLSYVKGVEVYCRAYDGLPPILLCFQARQAERHLFVVVAARTGRLLAFHLNIRQVLLWFHARQGEKHYETFWVNRESPFHRWILLYKLSFHCKL